MIPKGPARAQSHATDDPWEIDMDSEVFTIAALALLVAGGWLIDLLNHREESRLSRGMARQIKKSTDTIHGMLH